MSAYTYFRSSSHLSKREIESVSYLVEQHGDEFYPPLSARRGTSQTDFSDVANGGETYLDELLRQQFVFSRQGRTMRGFLSYKPDKDGYLYVSTVIVDSRFRGHGIACDLLLALMRTGKPIRLRTWEGNAAMIRTVESLGFRLEEAVNENRGDYMIPSLYFEWMP